MNIWRLYFYAFRNFLHAKQFFSERENLKDNGFCMSYFVYFSICLRTFTFKMNLIYVIFLGFVRFYKLFGHLSPKYYLRLNWSNIFKCSNGIRAFLRTKIIFIQLVSRSFLIDEVSSSRVHTEKLVCSFY